MIIEYNNKHGIAQWKPFGFYCLWTLWVLSLQPPRGCAIADQVVLICRISNSSKLWGNDEHVLETKAFHFTTRLPPSVCKYREHECKVLFKQILQSALSTTDTVCYPCLQKKTECLLKELDWHVMLDFWAASGTF